MFIFVKTALVQHLDSANLPFPFLQVWRSPRKMPNKKTSKRKRCDNFRAAFHRCWMGSEVDFKGLPKDASMHKAFKKALQFAASKICEHIKMFYTEGPSGQQVQSQFSLGYWEMKDWVNKTKDGIGLYIEMQLEKAVPDLEECAARTRFMTAAAVSASQQAEASSSLREGSPRPDARPHGHAPQQSGSQHGRSDRRNPHQQSWSHGDGHGSDRRNAHQQSGPHGHGHRTPPRSIDGSPWSASHGHGYGSGRSDDAARAAPGRRDIRDDSRRASALRLVPGSRKHSREEVEVFRSRSRDSASQCSGAANKGSCSHSRGNQRSTSASTNSSCKSKWPAPLQPSDDPPGLEQPSRQ